MLFQLKPQAMFEDKTQTAESGAPREEGERDRIKKQMTVGEKREESQGLFNMC